MSSRGDREHHGANNHYYDRMHRHNSIFSNRPVGLLHGIQLQHLVQPSLAVLFVKCVDDVPHDLESPVYPMKATTLLFLDCFMASANRLRGQLSPAYFHR